MQTILQKKYLGIILGALYGLVYRAVNEIEDVGLFDYSIFSISFFWILPVAIGLIPIWFARKEIIHSRWRQILFPVGSVFLFFTFALASGLEDMVCVLILSLPFVAAAGISGIVFSEIIKRRESNKLLSLIFLPFLFVPLESSFPDKLETFESEQAIIIESSSAHIWEFILEVPEIENSEYDYGFYNYIGIPRPVRSVLHEENGTEYRIGYFTDGLSLYEEVTQKEINKFVEFKIILEKSKLRDLPTDKHILKSDYFAFESISYELVELDENRTELILNCSYSIESKMNWYAGFWAKEIIMDFERKLLDVLKVKVETQNK